VKIASPIPAGYLIPAAQLWWAAFAPPLSPGPPLVRACHGIAAIDGAGRLGGVAGLRDAGGGFLAGLPLAARLLYRAAPATADLVIDGIVAARRGQGVGRALVENASHAARRSGHPGLRAEVEVRNHAGMAFYAALGFAEIGRGRFGWPWSGPVALLRRPV
jgi:GNAT superfamily N-acetyltransferase